MNTNKIVIYVTIIAITLIIFVPTFYKVININQQRLNEVNEMLLDVIMKENVKIRLLL